MANPWFRLYSEFAHDPKVQVLTESLQRRYVMALCIQCSGHLENRPDDEIALSLRVTVEDWISTKNEFIKRGLFTPDGKINGWEKRQFISDIKDSTAAVRQKRYRDNKRNERNATVTSQLPEQIQNRTDTETEQKKPLVASVADRPDCPHQKIIDLYHKILPELSAVKVWHDKRRKSLQARWRESEKQQTMEFWERFFNFVRICPHLMGENERQWQADLEWMLVSSNFTKIIEGKYRAE